MPGSPSPQRRSPSLEGETTVRDADKGLDQDELVKQVMEELRAQGTTGGGKPASTEEVVDIKIDAATHIRPAPQIERTGRDYGLKVQQKLEEEKRRTLRVGGLSVKLPSAKTGEHARGTLTAKIRRVSQKLSSTPAETLSAKMQRQFGETTDDSSDAFRGADAVLALVGESVRAELLEQLPALQQVVSGKLATLGLVQRTVDLHCTKLCGKSGSFQPFRFHPFGSTALGLCQQESDLDIFAMIQPELFAEFVPESNLAAFQRCTSQQQAKHFLQTVLSPALDVISVEKKEVLDARVPVLRLSLRPVLDATEADDEQRVDVCLSPEGWLKAEHFYDKFASGPAAYGVVLLLTTWARGVGLVRSSGAQAPAAGAGEAALVPGEWQALLLYLLETDDALQKTVVQCARPSGLRTAKVEARLVQLMDFAQSAAHQDYMDLGRLLHAFLAALRNLKEEAVRFEWPITDRPYHELFRGACKMVASCSKHAAEILAASRRVQTMLRSCSENTGASIARRLSRALSHRPPQVRVITVK
ncbi:hypothetical protein AK812_SmicGene21946 [Symbiodinium microadriaticum]|uniref:Poly(A) RNA polymerase mitochondrial-like central palm domain-containing protein n=1 Tax=Symbiodinium microadriaticum TaxID=2951 RepID=A0A1Q9DL77_SYMMI|nr:hypothetical protein AK812_SmicGene21946 [Symbiodinium microadriaticum]